MKNLVVKVKNVLVKPDGSVNGRVLAPVIGLGLVAIQQVFACFGIRFHGDLGAWQNLINTVLTLLGVLGVVADPTPVDAIKPEERVEEQPKAEEEKPAVVKVAEPEEKTVVTSLPQDNQEQK